MGKNDQLGAKLGPRIAQLVSQSIVSTHKNLAGHKHNVAMSVFEGMSDQISAEVDVALKPVFLKMLDDPDLHPDLRPHLEFMAHGHGQLKALIGQSAAGASILDPLAKVITNWLAPTVRGIVSLSPNAVPDPATLAQALAAGIGPENDIRYNLAGQGFGGLQSSIMVEASMAYPDLGTALEMYRRGLISQEALYLALQRNGMPIEYRGAVNQLREVILSPADAALAVLRGNMSNEEGVRISEHNGVSPADFAVLIGNTGEPLGLEQMLEAYRRGFIDQGTLEKGIRESRVRNEWISTAVKLRYAPMSTADAVQAVVQNHISPSQGESISQQNGLQPGTFTTLVETAGAPLSRTEMSELVNRGLASEADFVQAMRESRLKDKYTTKAYALRDRLIPERTLVSMIGHGVLTSEDALHRLMSLGFDRVSASLLISQGSATKTAAHKELAVSAVTALYEASAITQAQAVVMLEKLNYSAEEAAFLLEIADMKRIQRVVDSAVTAIRSRYVARKLSDIDASTALDSLGVAATSRDLYLSVWSIERSIETRQLTAAQIHSAVKKTIITPDDGLSRLVAMGYSQDDATLLLEL